MAAIVACWIGVNAQDSLLSIALGEAHIIWVIWDASAQPSGHFDASWCCGV